MYPDLIYILYTVHVSNYHTVPYNYVELYTSKKGKECKEPIQLQGWGNSTPSLDGEQWLSIAISNLPWALCSHVRL
jgi:hypothetical protein